MSMKITVVGLGYIGLPTAAVLAVRKMQVLGVDINQKAVDTINRGEIHIVEPELDVLVRTAVSTGHLRASTKAEGAEVFIVAVPTPFKEGYEPDLSYIEAASHSIAPVLKKGDLVILESTSPVGATEALAGWLYEQRPDLKVPVFNGKDDYDIFVAHCPERVLPGKVVHEIISNDRIIGGVTPNCAEKAVKLYQSFVEGECLVTDCRTAEMCKLVENSFRDVNIAFANELSMIADELSIDVWELIRLANRHPRVNILNPGPGVGGHCIAVDPWFIVSSAPNTANLIRTARNVNDAKPNYVFHQVCEKADAFKKPVIVCLGIAFKADIDDLRESPALDISLKLAEQSIGRVLIVEPNIDELPKKFSGLDVELVSLEKAFIEGNEFAVLVDHKQWFEPLAAPYPLAKW